MFGNSVFMALMGAVPPPAPVVPQQITLSPVNPGDLGTAPNTWTTTVNATGLTQIKWIIGVDGAKTIQFPYNVNNNISVVGYNHGDTINFTGYGANFALTKDASGPNMFMAQGANGFDTFSIGSETQVSDIRYTIDGAGGTGVPAYTLVNLVNNSAVLTVQFQRPGDSLIIKSVDETVSAVSGSVMFNTPAAKSITLVPHNPGDLVNPPANWTTRVNAVGITQIQWIVLDQNWVGTTGIAVVDLVNNTALITCTFLKVGERLVVKSMDELTQDVSGDVAFSGVVKSISINPQLPGNLGAAPKNWTTTVTATGQAQVKWAVFNVDNTATSAWNVADVVNNTVNISPQFTQAGQYLQVVSLDDLIKTLSGNVSFDSVTVPAQTTDDYQFAYDFQKSLTVNVNIERDNFWGKDAAYFQKLKTDGDITAVRMFLNSRPAWGFADYNKVESMLDACAAAISVGLKVHSLDLLDIMPEVECGDPQVIPYLNRCCDQIAARNFDPRMISVGPANEGEVEFNSNYNPYRESWDVGMRQRLQNHVLVSSSAYWGHVDHITDGTLTLLPGKRRIYTFHMYQWFAEQISDAQYCSDKILAWGDANGIVVGNGEYGKNATNNTQGYPGVDPYWIPQVIYAASRGMPKVKPNFWAITDGSYYRMNPGGSYDLTPEIAAALREANAYIRSLPGFGT